jgi:hypothetical protein
MGKLPALPLTHAHDGGEDVVLEVGRVDTQGPAPDLRALPHEIVVETADGKGIAIQQVHVMRVGCSEGMMHGLVLSTIGFIGRLEEREGVDPAEATAWDHVIAIGCLSASSFNLANGRTT